MYSLRMSFCKRAAQLLAIGAPCASACAMYMAQIDAAGELIVIDVVIEPRGIPVEEVSMSANEC
jgi:hypothetical protein